jgi:ribosomal protein L11 methyltransferase
VKEGGLFLCSGIIDTRADEVKGKILEAGLTILQERSSEGWFAFSCQ